MVTFPKPIIVSTTSVTVTSLPFILLDDPQQKITQVRFKSVKARLTVWSGANYKPVGTYTQEQLEEAVSALLGSDPATTLSALATGQAATPVKTPATPQTAASSSTSTTTPAPAAHSA